jgi:4-diphosphocytidyl-2-C-methyl-D-erythritol kinase
LRYRAYAKVNLSLEVLGKRPDGFHDLASVMQTVSLCDEIELCEGDDVEFSCSEPTLQNADNLVVRAARRLREAAGSQRGCHLVLQKAIPQAAGLGGGSSDAAAALTALNDWWSLDRSMAQLAEIGAELGSDVPFFLYGGTALVMGRGEVVRPLPDPTPVWFALVKPPIAVPTVKVFRSVSRDDWTDGAATYHVARLICDGHGVTLGINGLQRTLFELCPEARTCFDEVNQAAPGRCFVSGSGPTIGAVCRSRMEAEKVIAAAARPGQWTAVVHTVRRAQ